LSFQFYEHMTATCISTQQTPAAWSPLAPSSFLYDLDLTKDSSLEDFLFIFLLHCLSSLERVLVLSSFSWL